jgi:hypothetical protein
MCGDGGVYGGLAGRGRGGGFGSDNRRRRGEEGGTGTNMRLIRVEECYLSI